MLICNFICYQQHYVSYLNCLRQGEFKEALESLYHYFDGQQWQGLTGTSGIDADDSDVEGCCRFRYAALNLAALHCRFGHRYAMQESLR